MLRLISAMGFCALLMLYMYAEPPINASEWWWRWLMLFWPLYAAFYPEARDRH